MDASQSWLRKVAEAFGVSLQRAPGEKCPPFKSKHELITDVAASVASAAKGALNKKRLTDAASSLTTGRFNKTPE